MVRFFQKQKKQFRRQNSIMVDLVDSHVHPHFEKYNADRSEVLARSYEAGVKRLIAVGCSLEDSQLAVDLAEATQGVWASVGAHPHDGKDFLEDPNALSKFSQLVKKPKVVAIGEVGLDHYHEYTPRADQEKILRKQLEAGIDSGLPFIFHVREAFQSFWKIFDDYSTHKQPIKGVVHSFSAPPEVLDKVLSRGLYIGLNGLITYTKEESWRESAKIAPLDRILLETDAPFLTPVPHRGQRCEPKHVLDVARYLAEIRKSTLEEIADQTTINTVGLFKLGEERLSGS